MVNTTTRMKCPRCGAEMNHHADKLVYGVGESNSPDFCSSETLMEFHGCPNCGASTSREAVQLGLSSRPL